MISLLASADWRPPVVVIGCLVVAPTFVCFIAPWVIKKLRR